LYTSAANAELTFASHVPLPLHRPLSTDRFRAEAPPPSEKISAAEILKRHIEAMGGEEALRNLQTLHVRGALLNVVGNYRYGDVNFYYKAPDRDVFRLELPAHGLTALGHSGGKPFQEISQPDERILWPVRAIVAAMETACVANIEWAHEQNYTRIELIGLTLIDGQWTYGLRFTSQYGDPQLRFYDGKSFQLVRLVLLQRVGQEGKDPDYSYSVETTFSDYGTSGGIPFPKRLSVKGPHGNLYLEIQKVRRDEPVEDSLFTKKL
jgi:hypothetical protein